MALVIGQTCRKSAPGRRTIGPNLGFGHNLATPLTDFGAAVGGRIGRGPRPFPKLTPVPIAIGARFSATGEAGARGLPTHSLWLTNC